MDALKVESGVESGVEAVAVQGVHSSCRAAAALRKSWKTSHRETAVSYERPVGAAGEEGAPVELTPQSGLGHRRRQ